MQRSVTSLLNACCVVGKRSPQRWWCPLLSQNLAAQCTELFFVEPGVKVDSRYYHEVLLKKQMLPVMRHIAGDTYVFQQDGAPVHCAHETVQLLQQQTPQFISPDLWPPNSPDLNPVDYRIWGWMPVHDTDNLKRHLIDTWVSIAQSVVDNATDQWTIRLHACEKARGHFEHLL